MKRAPLLFLARVTCVALTMVAASCSDRSPLDGPPGAKLSYSQVKVLAEQTARANGVPLGNYDEPVLRYEATNSQDEWLVSFQMKSPASPSGAFLVVIDDSTSRATFHGGE